VALDSRVTRETQSRRVRSSKREALDVQPGKAYMHLNAHARAEHLSIREAVGYAYDMLRTAVQNLRDGRSTKSTYRGYRLVLNSIRSLNQQNIRCILLTRTIKECMRHISDTKYHLRVTGLSWTILARQSDLLGWKT